jgi:D-serine deaminase-like pyridoxal phosphate-dependent protein
MFFIDSLQALHVAEKALEGIPDGKLYLFIEVGAENGRAGLRNVEEILPITEAIKNNPRLHLLGVSGFEGIIPQGTPIIQLIPYRQENWTHKKTEGLLKKSNQHMLKTSSLIYGWYKKTFWTRKKYD